MKELIVARHGEYGCGNGDRFNKNKDVDHLTEQGRRSVKKLAEKLKLHAQDKSVTILSSTAIRAVESARIISKELKVKFKIHNALWHDDEYPAYQSEVLELIQSHTKTDVLILVTHREYTGYLPHYFSKACLNARLDSHPIYYARAWAIDCEKVTLSLI